MASLDHLALCHPLTFQSQLSLGVVVHLDGVRLKTQGWRDTSIGGIGLGGIKGSGPGKQNKHREGKPGLC